jgi:alpha-1,3-rhamnosyl/mannosyltransferase
MLAGTVAVAHSAHPLLMPARNAAQIVTIHDLFFLSRSDDTAAEIRRDYARLAASHAQRAHAVITSTQYGKSQIVERLGIAEDRIYVCPPGAPTWKTLGHQASPPANGCVLFIGTLAPRKNVGVLLDAYEQLLERYPQLPPLLLAGRATPAAANWLARINRAPRAGRVTHVGYVSDTERENLYRSARVLVMPSLDEGFGLPVLEAMSAGVPVIVSSVGSLPEVVQDAGAQVDPADAGALANAIERVMFDDTWALNAAQHGLARARTFTWAESARTLHRAYVEAVARHHEGRATRSDMHRHTA